MLRAAIIAILATGSALLLSGAAEADLLKITNEAPSITDCVGIACNSHAGTGTVFCITAPCPQPGPSRNPHGGVFCITAPCPGSSGTGDTTKHPGKIVPGVFERRGVRSI